MTPQEREINTINCCKTQEKINQNCCCGEAELQNQRCCCGEEEELQSQAGCCREEEPQAHAGCCTTSHNGEKDPSADNDNYENVSNSDTLQQLQDLLAAANDKYLRLYSEFDNFKKRAAKERLLLIDKANETTLKELLPIIDDFERAIIALKGEHSGIQLAMQEGTKLIQDKLYALLNKFGVKEIMLAQGDAFNADFHEAIMQQPVADPEMKGKVVSVVEKGYAINEYMLRFAKVVIGV